MSLAPARGRQLSNMTNGHFLRSAGKLAARRNVAGAAATMAATIRTDANADWIRVG